MGHYKTPDGEHIDREHWTNVMGEYVLQMAKATRQAYQRLFPDTRTKDREDGVKIAAEPLCALLSDGVLGFLAMLNESNERDVTQGHTPEKFDCIPMFLEELLVRTSSMGYSAAVDARAEPEAFEQVMDAFHSATIPPKVKQ